MGRGETRGRWERVDGGRQRAREGFVVFRVSIELLNARRDVYFGSCPLPTVALVPDLAFLAQKKIHSARQSLCDDIPRTDAAAAAGAAHSHLPFSIPSQPTLCLSQQPVSLLFW